MEILVRPTEVLDFVEYVDSFYNPTTGVFPIEGATVGVITKAVQTYLTDAKTNWGEGDSVDREFVRDIMFEIIKESK